MGIVIALPFSFNNSGAINTTNLETKTWSDRVVSAIMTRPLERIMFPEYGSGVTAAIFENENEATVIAKREIPAVFSRWLPELTLLSVSAVMETSELADNTLAISVEYLLPNKQKSTTTARVRLGSFTSTGLLIEEIQ